MKPRSLAAVIAVALIAPVVVPEGAAEAATLNGHTVVLDGSGRIIPWTAEPG